MAGGLTEFEDVDFRCLVANVCDRLSTRDLRKIVYIRLYNKRQQLKDADGLDIIDALECANVFSPAAPEGLLEAVEQSGNKQVANTIKDFIKKRRKRGTHALHVPAAPQAETDENTPADRAHLQACYKVVLGQTNLLLQQIEVIRQAVWAGSQDEDGKLKAHEAVENISKTASELVEGLKKARKQFGLLSRSSSGSSTDSSDSGSDTTGHYEPIANSVLGVHKAKKLPPPTKPRKPKPVLDVAQQETSHLQDSSIVISGRARSCHQGMEQQTVGPPGNHHRSIRYTKTTPNNQVQLEVAPPMAPAPLPRKARVNRQPQMYESPTENEYHVLQPFLGSEGSADSGIGASGTCSGDGEFTDAKRYAKKNIPSTKGAAEVRYNALNRNTMEEFSEYTSRNRHDMDKT